jgi:F-type H+-transporting ATPase subunit epsilon
MENLLPACLRPRRRNSRHGPPESHVAPKRGRHLPGVPSARPARSVPPSSTIILTHHVHLAPALFVSHAAFLVFKHFADDSLVTLHVTFRVITNAFSLSARKRKRCRNWACSFNKYSQIAARAVRASLKEEKRLVAEKRGTTSLRYQKWENGQGQQQVCPRPF